jgi:hypothetical protein
MIYFPQKLNRRQKKSEQTGGMRSSPGKNKVIAFWLIPAKAEQELFSELIRILAAQLDAPRFEAHLTICAVPDTRLAREALGQISVPPIRLQVLRLHVSNRFTKTLFVRFRRKRALDDLNASLRRTAQLPAGAVRDPHVSLLYKKMPMAAKRELASTIHLPLDEVAFDSMKAVCCDSPTESRADIEAWRVVASKLLRD